MTDIDLFESVELARLRLTALRADLEKDAASPGSREIVGALGDLLATFGKLQARYGLLRDILDRTNDLVFAKDEDGRYAMINPRGAEILGRRVTEILGSDDRALFDRPDAERIMAVDREVMRGGEPSTGEATYDLGGVSTTLLTTTTVWYDTERKVRGVIGISQDVTEKRRNEREAATDRGRMRSMAAELVIGEEQLRRSLAAELHHGLGQDIALAKMKLSMLRSSASVELHDPLNGIEQLVERADRSLRSITFQISPPSLHDLGLSAALQWLAEDVGRKYAIEVRVEDDDSPGIADERIRVILFRAVRELLINAATHARVRDAVVRLSGRDHRVEVSVSDSGVGFDMTDVDRRGYGLFGIREQLKYVNGSIHIDSNLGRGTTVTLNAPASEPLAATTPDSAVQGN